MNESLGAYAPRDFLVYGFSMEGVRAKRDAYVTHCQRKDRHAMRSAATPSQIAAIQLV